MATPSTPEDVDLPVMNPPVALPKPRGTGGAPPTDGGPGLRTAPPFDEDAAQAELEAAEHRVHDKCGPPELAEVKVRVTFDPSGDPTDAVFDPQGFTNTDYGRCVEGEVLDARVPRFDPVPNVAERTLRLRKPSG